MASGSPWDPCRSWTGGYCHPDAPAGGGGPGSFRQPGPLGTDASLSNGLPHPQSPAGRFQSHVIHTALFLQRVRALKLTYQRAQRGFGIRSRVLGNEAPRSRGASFSAVPSHCHYGVAKNPWLLPAVSR